MIRPSTTTLDVAPSDLAWVVTAYALAGGGLLLLGGRAADLLGRRPVFLAGLALLTVASLASGLATSPDMLVASRAAQGIGAALLTPGALSIAVAAHVAAHLLPRAGARVLAAGGIGLVALAAGLMAAAPDHASYAADLLPAFLLLGFGAGLSFPAASVTAMSDVGPARAGVASGFMTTAHEVGATLGVAVLAAVAATGDAAADALTAGYGDAFLVATVTAGAAALAALATFPAVRPAAGARVAMH